MTEVIAAVDSGTSSTRCMLFDKDGHVVAMHQIEHPPLYPQRGWVELDSNVIWTSARQCISKACTIASTNAAERIVIAGLGITNQRESTIVWNRHTGRAYYNTILWNDTRTSHICNKISAEEGIDRFRAKTGLPIATYFSASKIMYLLETIPGLREDAIKGDALFGTVDTWLIWKLTAGKTHATDVTNASRTMLMDLQSTQWDLEILKQLEIPIQMMPEIRSSSEIYAHVSNVISSIDAGVDEMADVPIAGVLGDQQAALFGQTCFEVGESKCTYGTGAFLLMNTGKDLIHSNTGLLTTVAHKLGKDSPTYYALEGSIAYGGSLIAWLKDNLELMSHSKQTEEMASKVKDNGGVYFVPAFAGLYAPYWRDDARGIIAGLTAYNNKYHIIRAALEATALQTSQVLDAMQEDSKIKINELKVDGGMTKNNLLIQFQSDIINLPVRTPFIAETTALGAAFSAGLAVKFWSNQTELKKISLKDGKAWNPTMDESQRSNLKHNWLKAVARSLNWVEKNDGDIYLKYLHTKSSIIVPSKHSKPFSQNIKKYGRRIGVPLMCFAAGLIVGTQIMQ